MLRHILLAHASITEVMETLRRAGNVYIEAVDTERAVLHVAGGVGLIDGRDGTTAIDVLQFDDTLHVGLMIAALREAGIHVEHKET